MADDDTEAHAEGPATAGDGDGSVRSVDLLAAHQSGDHVLAMYVAVFNENPGLQMAVTVFSGGYAFSGQLVGASEYFDRVAELVDDEAISIPFRRMADDYRGDTGDDKQLVTTYLHMLDVEVFGGAKHLRTLTAWRGRLSQISGWTVERIAPKR